MNSPRRPVQPRRAASPPATKAAKSARGRRAEGDSRADILEAARELFAAKGFKATTTRQVAERAGVDAALIHHFFGSKLELFKAAINIEQMAAALASELAASSGADAAEGLVRLYLERLFPAQASSLAAVLRTALGSPDEVPQLREMLHGTIVAVASRAIQGEDAALRAELIGSQMMGLLLMRHVVGVEPVASASIDDLVRLLVPPLRTLIEGERP
ncbi:MAG: TetR family transcriptional regulator [Chloroflexota bacterium]